MNNLMLYGIVAAGIVFVGIVLPILLSILFRVVVSTNDVHIVQSARKTVSYGKDQAAGNTYYQWPAWFPLIGVRVSMLPVSVFDVDLTSYAAYDKGRVPFVIDIMAFFRIEDSNIAAQRVHDFPELEQQLKGILQGACRSILASSEIEEILEGRSKFGEMFTEAVDKQLKAWGVTDVKNIELMDIRDAEGSKVIENIMAKKKSLIERQSREAVAENLRAAKEAEIIATREVDIRAQEAEQQVSTRTIEKDKQVGILKEQAWQAIKDQAVITTTKAMAVTQIEQVRKAEIARDVELTAADQEKRTAVIRAEGHKQQVILVAEGDLESTKRRAEGTQIEGIAKGEAEKAVLLAPVQAQITLAKEIGENPGYQTYLVSVRQIEANQVVGIEQAKALTAAEIKVIANAGNPVDGIKDVMGLFTAKGGTQLGGMLEALKNTETGAALIKRATGTNGAA